MKYTEQKLLKRETIVKQNKNNKMNKQIAISHVLNLFLSLKLTYSHPFKKSVHTFYTRLRAKKTSIFCDKIYQMFPVF